MLKYILATTILLFFWQIIAQTSYTPIASPIATFLQLYALLLNGNFWAVVFINICDIIIGILFAFSLALFFNIVSVKIPLLHIILKMVVLFLSTLPWIVFSILGLLWVNQASVVTMLAALAAFSHLYPAIYAAIKNTDGRLLDMAWFFKISLLHRLFYIYSINTPKYIIPSLELAIASAFKAGTTAKIMYLIYASIYYELYNYTLSLYMPYIFSWILAIFIISFCFKKIIVFNLKRFLK